MDLGSDEVGENSEKRDSNIQMVPKDQQCLPVYIPCAPYSACTPLLINLPFPNEFNWSYTGRNYDEQVPVVPAKKSKEKTEENKNEHVVPAKKSKAKTEENKNEPVVSAKKRKEKTEENKNEPTIKEK